MAVIILRSRDNTYHRLKLLVPELLEKLSSIGKGEVAEIGDTGS